MQAMSLRMEMDMDRMDRYEEPGSEVPSARSSEKLRLVPADDDTDTRKLLACLLRWEGYEVLEASEGVGLLARLEATTLDGTRLDAIVRAALNAQHCLH